MSYGSFEETEGGWRNPPGGRWEPRAGTGEARDGAAPPSPFALERHALGLGTESERRKVEAYFRTHPEAAAAFEDGKREAEGLFAAARIPRPPRPSSHFPPFSFPPFRHAADFLGPLLPSFLRARPAAFAFSSLACALLLFIPGRLLILKDEGREAHRSGREKPADPGRAERFALKGGAEGGSDPVLDVTVYLKSGEGLRPLPRPGLARDGDTLQFALLGAPSRRGLFLRQAFGLREADLSPSSFSRGFPVDSLPLHAGARLLPFSLALSPPWDSLVLRVELTEGRAGAGDSRLPPPGLSLRTVIRRSGP